MRVPVKLALSGLSMAVVFGGAAAVAGAVVPRSAVDDWNRSAASHADERGSAGPAAQGETDMQGMEHSSMGTGSMGSTLLGLGLADGGFSLAAVSAPETLGAGGELRFTVQGDAGEPVNEFDVEYEKELHLIVVRTDGQYFRHVHPERDESGVWSIPWQWDAAGSYRAFADFVPSATGDGTTLSTVLNVSGEFQAQRAGEPVTEATVDGYTVSVSGDLAASTASSLTVNVSRNGEPVTALEPYLGAYGHLVALRDGDLAYLHVHPSGDEPKAGETSGPDVVFETTTPTAGKYLLYFDFKVGGQVYSAPLVLDAAEGAEAGGSEQLPHDEGASDEQG